MQKSLVKYKTYYKLYITNQKAHTAQKMKFFIKISSVNVTKFTEFLAFYLVPEEESPLTNFKTMNDK